MMEKKELFSVKLDCNSRDPAAMYQHQSAFAAASLLYNSYTASKDMLIGTGPELYAEQWIFNFVVFSNEEFDDLILTYFTKILQGAQKNG